MDETTMKLGLLMEAALANQKAAESSLRKLKSVTAELGTVVREEVDRVLREDLQALAGDVRRASDALRGVRRAANLRLAFWGVAMTSLCAVIPLGLALWIIPSRDEIAALRARRDALTTEIRRLEEQGARIDLRRCGEGGRLCVRVDRKAPVYGVQSDYLIVRGY
jgi:polyhydroxyalkanoate synthesis regulator phasin